MPKYSLVLREAARRRAPKTPIVLKLIFLSLSFSWRKRVSSVFPDQLQDKKNELGYTRLDRM